MAPLKKMMSGIARKSLKGRFDRSLQRTVGSMTLASLFSRKSEETPSIDIAQDRNDIKQSYLKSVLPDSELHGNYHSDQDKDLTDMDNYIDKTLSEMNSMSRK